MQQPLDLVRLSLGSRVRVKLRHGRHLTGTLEAYDAHLNVLMRDVQERVTREGEDEVLGRARSKVSGGVSRWKRGAMRCSTCGGTW